MKNKDPFPLKVRYKCKCAKCNAVLMTGVDAFYYPATRQMFCISCGIDEYNQFLSSVFDESVYAGTGNPF